MRSILIADDHPGCRDSMARLLRRLGYRTLPAGNANEALDVLQQSMIDLAILDLDMPQGGGLRVLRTISLIRPQLPVLMVSGHSSRQSLLRAYAAGAYGYLPKPIRVPLLKKLLSEVTSSHALVTVSRRTVIRIQITERKPHAED